jgi:hypothetical protein
MLAFVPSVSPDALARGQRHRVLDLAWASVTGAFSGGMILVAFALALGASPIQAGLLAAIPFIARVARDDVSRGWEADDRAAAERG